ncbi:hypothetical protein REJ26_000558 [Providencia stuartii]|uniref:hypothetical protein n=1 Tax=Providencia sp. 2023EL-00965 TaxID=3084975 RepID=UPI0027EA2B3D|nr:hypothetical protein [Providencia sp. 2023EL-00965]ELR5298834.1 hypothetical protein [Providencia stuartii]MDW7587288.1 hypothetical protein [Providencia sp. 2023EL-00965]
MRFSRIKAVCIDNSPQSNDILVFDALLKQDGFIEKMEIFGYISHDYGKWPIYIKYEGNKGNIYWGSDPDSETSELSTTYINIFNKQIRFGEYITYSEIDDNNIRKEYTYRITDIRDWNEHYRN